MTRAIQQPGKPVAASPSGIRLRAVSKAYGRHQILHDLDLDVRPGELLAMLGPSGSGKTTVLKIIAGFEDPDAGGIMIDDRDMSGVPPERRDIGVVFQNYSLFPHMTVGANVGFPLRMRRMPKAQRSEAVSRALAQVSLEGFEARMPTQLSGGQQQRVAIARAIVYEPKVLLMDEPLGALDRRLRGDMQIEIKALHDRLGMTVVYVTHDQDEALSMSDRVLVFNKGRVEQAGAPRDVYRHPATQFVADFLGDSLSLSAVADGQRARLANIDLDVVLDQAEAHQGPIKLLWRSDRITLDDAGPARQAAAVLVLPATVLASSYGGDAVRLRVRLPTGDIGIVAVAEDTVAPKGTSVAIRFDLSTATILPVRQAPLCTEA